MFFVIIIFLIPFSATLQQGTNIYTEQSFMDWNTQLTLVQNISYAQQNTNSAIGNGSGSGSFDSALKAVIGFIGNILLFIGSILLRAGGVFFEAAVKFLVIDFKSTSPLLVIHAIWQIVRDICNLAFIFGFIYLGIKTIFDPESAQTKRWLTKIIIGALLINFSLLFTKVIVDIGNYTAIVIEAEGSRAFGGNTLPASIINTIELSKIFGGKDVSGTLGAMFAYYLMAFIFLCVCGIVLMFVAFQLVTRFITIIIILMASPFLFAGTVFPQTEKHVSKLWATLIGHSFYPAIFLFLAFISVKIVSFIKITVLTKTDDIAKSLQTNDSVGFMQVILMFVIAMILFIESHVIAKKISESGGSMSVESIKGARSRAVKMAGGATAGLAARGLRATVGQRAHERLNDENLKARVVLEGKDGNKARAQLMRAQKMASGTYDVRNVKIGEKSVGNHLGMGAGIKDGYKQQVDAKMEAEKEFAKNLGYDKQRVLAAEEAGDSKIERAKENLATIKNELKEATHADRAKLTEVNRHTHETSVALKDATENLTRAETDEDRIAIQATINSLSDQKKAHINEINAINASIQNTTEGYQERITQAQKDVTQAQKDKTKNMAEEKIARQKAYAGVVASGKGVTSRIATGHSLPIFSRYTNTTHSNTFVAEELKKTAEKEKNDIEKLSEQISGMTKH